MFQPWHIVHCIYILKTYTVGSIFSNSFLIVLCRMGKYFFLFSFKLIRKEYLVPYIRKGKHFIKTVFLMIFWFELQSFYYPLGVNLPAGIHFQYYPLFLLRDLNKCISSIFISWKYINYNEIQETHMHIPLLRTAYITEPWCLSISITLIIQLFCIFLFPAKYWPFCYRSNILCLCLANKVVFLKRKT